MWKFIGLHRTETCLLYFLRYQLLEKTEPWRRDTIDLKNKQPNNHHLTHMEYSAFLQITMMALETWADWPRLSLHIKTSLPLAYWRLNILLPVRITGQKLGHIVSWKLLPLWLQHDANQAFIWDRQELMWICSNNFPVTPAKWIENVNASNGKPGTLAVTWIIRMWISPIISVQTLKSMRLRSQGSQLKITKGLSLPEGS